MQGGSKLQAQFGSDVVAGDLSSSGLGGASVVDGSGSTLGLNSSSAKNSVGAGGGTGTLTYQNSSTGNSISGAGHCRRYFGEQHRCGKYYGRVDRQFERQPNTGDSKHNRAKRLIGYQRNRFQPDASRHIIDHHRFGNQWQCRPPNWHSQHQWNTDHRNRDADYQQNRFALCR